MNSRTRKLIELAQRRLQESKQQQLTDEQRLLIEKLAEVYKLQLEIDDDILTEELERLNTLERELIAKINETFTE
jgi:DNA replication initiation complex subunit (GINS family)